MNTRDAENSHPLKKERKRFRFEAKKKKIVNTHNKKKNVHVCTCQDSDLACIHANVLDDEREGALADRSKANHQNTTTKLYVLFVRRSHTIPKKMKKKDVKRHAMPHGKGGADGRMVEYTVSCVQKMPMTATSK